LVRGIRTTQQTLGKPGEGGGFADARGERPATTVVAREGRPSARREEVTYLNKEA
jgi:hypothetical protein